MAELAPGAASSIIWRSSSRIGRRCGCCFAKKPSMGAPRSARRPNFLAAVALGASGWAGWAGLVAGFVADFEAGDPTRFLVGLALGFTSPMMPQPSRLFPPRRMQRFPARAQLHELSDARATCLWLLGGLDPIEDGVAIRTVERLEERAGLGIAGQRGRQIGRHRRDPRALVGARPTAVSLGALDLGQPRGFDRPAGDQSLGSGAVDLRPRAARAARGEPLGYSG